MDLVDVPVELVCGDLATNWFVVLSDSAAAIQLLVSMAGGVGGRKCSQCYIRFPPPSCECSHGANVTGAGTN